jgi:hypothetical protein
MIPAYQARMAANSETITNQVVIAAVIFLA